ncbi:MFS transporter, partial [Cronobacter dublinensis]
IGVFMVPGAVKRFGKKRVYLGGLALWATGDIFNYLWGATSLSFVLFSCMAFFGTAFVNSLNWALVPDTVDYGEWKTGIRAEGSVYTGYTFSRKISAALAGFLPGIMLTQIGYVPNALQTAATLDGLRQLIFLWPCGLAMI